MGDDYSFLQEKIKDEAGSPKTIKKKIAQMIILGFIFGIIACFTFFALKPFVADLLGQDKEEVSIPEDEETAAQGGNEAINAEVHAEEQQQMRMLKDFQNMAKEKLAAVVCISGQKTIEKDAEREKTSGVIIADNGSEILVLSQTLSDKELKNITITFSDGKEYPATVKMKDNNIGIVICAVDKEILRNDTLKQMKIMTLGNSLIVKSGEPIILLGKAAEETSLVSYGFVASSEEKKEIADGFVDLLRVDVAGAGFENGILLNQDGEMIGLVNASASENKTLVTVYSISDIKNEIERMSNGKGVPYVGIWGVELPEEIKEEGVSEGICVKEMDTDSPAMEAGIQCGDVITQINDTTISDMEEYRNALLEETVRGVITVTGLRKGADDNYIEMKFKVVVGRK